MVGGTVATTTGTYSFTTGTNAAISNYNGAIVSGTLTDYRQGYPSTSNNVKYTQVNVGTLTSNLNQIGPLIGNTPDVIYMRNAANDSNQASYDSYGGATGTTGSKLAAFKLTNGATISLPAMTIASQNPVYIQGDFNTNGSNPPSDLTATYVTGTNYYKVSGSATGNYGTSSGPPPVAIVADAISILSNSWKDSSSNANLSATSPNPNRTPTGTTINAAFLSGQVPTNQNNGSSANGNYSGGVENYPRFLENWSGSIPFGYSGSIVELFKSKQAFIGWQGTGGTPGVYNAPFRNWSFDMHFLTSPPAGFNYTIVFSRYQWFLQ